MLLGLSVEVCELRIEYGCSWRKESEDIGEYRQF
jgi:hypothetical protein